MLSCDFTAYIQNNKQVLSCSVVLLFLLSVSTLKLNTNFVSLLSKLNLQRFKSEYIQSCNLYRSIQLILSEASDMLDTRLLTI